MNQTVAIARAGMPVCFAGKLGGDGGALKELLAGEVNINTDCLLTDAQEQTGHAIIQVDRMGENSIVVYGGANQRITKEDIDCVLSCFTAGDVIVLQNEISCIPYILRSAHERGMKIVFTPAPFRETLYEMTELQFVDWLLLNQVEGNLLTDGNADPHITCKRLKNLLPHTNIILTLGKDGSLYYDGKGFILQKSYRIQTVDTTAAGDTFAGYFVAMLMRGRTVADAMDLASKAAAIAVSRKGAFPSMPTLKEVTSWVFRE